MGTRSAAVDAYISRARPFARPILEHLREVVHAACPDVAETIKWGMPFFMYEGMLGHMAAFQGHAAFGFHRHAVLVRESGLQAGFDRSAMGSFGRLTSVKDLPPRRVLLALVKLAMTLNAGGGSRAPRATAKARPAIRSPAAFLAALRADREASATWAAFPPGKRRDYLEWITEAKTAATRAKRIVTSVAWLAQGRARNWKYEAGRARGGPEQGVSVPARRRRAARAGRAPRD